MVLMAKISTRETSLQRLDRSPASKTEEPFAVADAVFSPGGTGLSSDSRLAFDLPPLAFPNDRNGTIPSRTTSPGEFPIYVVVIIASVFFLMTSTFLYFLCRCLVRKKKREDQLSTLAPPMPDYRMAGVRADHPIQFVVPTTVVVSETTEDSVSETDYSSSGAKVLPMVTDRRRKKPGFQISPEDLQHGLYVGLNAASEKGTFVGDLGKVGFSLRYNLQRCQLTVKIVGARDLPCHSLRTTANPCVKLVLLPDRTTKYVTKVLKNTTSPNFNESFTFCVRRDELSEKKLKISVWDYDRFSRKCLIGQVVYNVRDSGLTNTLSVDAASGEIWVDMKQDSVVQHGENGEMLLSLCYEPDSAILTLTVLKIRGLDMRQEKGKDTSIYAKVTLYVRRKLVRTKKTPSRKKAPEVELNSPFSIHVPQAALPEVDLMVVVCEKWPLGKRVLGRTQAGTNCLCDQGLQHWQDMLASPKSTCAQWHVLCG